MVWAGKVTSGCSDAHRYDAFFIMETEVENPFKYGGYEVALVPLEAIKNGESTWSCTVYIRVDEDSHTESFVVSPPDDLESDAMARAKRVAEDVIDKKNAASAT